MKNTVISSCGTQRIAFHGPPAYPSHLRNTAHDLAQWIKSGEVLVSSSTHFQLITWCTSDFHVFTLSSALALEYQCAPGQHSLKHLVPLDL